MGLKKKSNTLRAEGRFGLTVALIPLIGYLLLQLVPLCVAISTMFVDMKGYQLNTMQWNHFATFKEVLADEKFWVSLTRTLGLLMTQFVSLFIALVTSTLLA